MEPVPILPIEKAESGDNFAAAVTASSSYTKSLASIFQGFVRPIIMLALTGTTCYLAIMGMAEARTALLGAFTILVGALWGERAALKIPGQSS